MALTEYRAYIARVMDEFLGLASALTADENMQDRVVKELWKRVKR